MRNRPYILFMCMFLSGILCALTGNKWITVFAALLFLYAAPWKEQKPRGAVFAIVLPLLFVSGLVHTKRECAFRENCLKELKDGREVKLAGKVERVEQKPRCFYYFLTDCTVSLSKKHVPCNDVIAYVSADDYSIGQILVLNGKISYFEEAANEGNFDARSFYQSQKIDFGLRVENVEQVYGKGNVYKQWLSDIRKRLQGLLDATDHDGILSAMLLGEKSGLDSDTKTLYQRAGIAHILAISGLHVSLLGMGVYRLFRRLGISCPAAAAVTAVLMVSYTVMTGNSVSARRATGMLLICLLADWTGYGYDLLSALGAVVIFLLWENPFLTGYTGFLFSVAAVSGVGIGGSIINRYKNQCDGSPGKEKRKRLAKFIQGQKEGMGISLGIQLFTLPLVAYSYYEVPVYAMLLNIFVLALVNWLLIFTVSGVAAGLLVQKLGKLFLLPCGWILQIYELLCRCSLSLPGAVNICGKPAAWKIAVYYSLLACLLFAMWKRTVAAEKTAMEAAKRKPGKDQEGNNRRRENIRGKIVPAAAVFLLLSVLFFPEKPEFEIDMLNVGQGDGIYICTSDGISLFIDGGSTDTSKVGKYRILPFLKSRGAEKISWWFVSHTDADHISGLEEALSEGYCIENLVFAKASEKEEKTMELCRLAEKNNTRVIYLSAGNVLHMKQAAVRCLYPDKDEKAEINDRCLVLEFVDNGVSAFFGGDISEETEKKLLASGVCSAVSLFKADHHGSRYSNSTALLEVLCPEITVASAGEKNRYGHPSEEAVERIRGSGSVFYCTAGDGQVKIKKRGDGLTRVK